MSVGKEQILSIVVSYNCDEIIIEEVAALKNDGIDVLILDNGSNSKGLSIIERCVNDYACQAIYNEDNMGIAFALNQGVSYAVEYGYRWVLTLDQDSLVTPGMVETMLNVYESLNADEREATAGLFAMPIEKALAEPGDFCSEQDNIDYDNVLVGITSGNLIRTEVFEKVGLFDEKLFIDYVDHDFYLRLTSAGYKLLECRGAKLIHCRGNYTQKNLLGKVTATTNHSAFRWYYITRNRMYIWKTYAARHPEFVRHDKKTFRKQLLKLLLVEDNKWAKLKMLGKGVIDCRHNKYGKLIER